MPKKPQKAKKGILSFSKLSLLLIFLIFLFLPGQNVYQVPFVAKRPQVAGFSSMLPSPAPYPVNSTGVLPPVLTAQAILVTDISSKVVLYQQNQNARLSPASLTKIMTALVTLDQYRMEDVLIVKTVVSEGRKMGLVSGEEMTFENLLYGTLVHSANDAAYTLAENYPGGVSEFVVKMNEKAKKLSLLNTNFTNPIGFEENGHYTTASDLSRLTTYALQNKVLARIVGTPAITVSDSSFTRFHQLENVNKLLGKVSGVWGVKTGWTENAGECLVTAVTKDGRKILTIILSSKDRFGETEQLINWVFGNFHWETIEPPKES